MYTKFPYGTSVENDQLLLPDGMLSIDIEKKAIRLHDGQTQGGFEMIGQQAYVPPPGYVWRAIQMGPSPTNQATFVSLFAAGPTKQIASNGYATWVSDDQGDTWTDITAILPEPSVAVSKVRYFDGNFYIIKNGTLYRSSDLSTFTGVTITGINNIKDIAYNGTVWLILSRSVDIHASSDLITATQIMTNLWVRDIYTDGVYFGIRDNRNGAFIRISTDGSTWQSAATDHGGGITGLCSYNGTVIVTQGAAGSCMRFSPDGTAEVNTDVAIQGVVHNGDHYLGFYSSQIYRSLDGLTWTQLTPDVSYQISTAFSATKYNNKIYVVGRYQIDGVLTPGISISP